MSQPEPRYFVDIRVGCVAVRDRTKSDQEYYGLHSDTPGVVKYWNGVLITKICSECGNKTSYYGVTDESVNEAEALCDQLNKNEQRNIQ